MREQQRLLNDEKKDQETQQMLKYLQRLQEEDMEALKEKKEKQAEIMVEVSKANQVRDWMLSGGTHTESGT